MMNGEGERRRDRTAKMAKGEDGERRRWRTAKVPNVENAELRTQNEKGENS
jgi:hypothetical protein